MQICSGTQVSLKRDSSFLLFYCDKTSLRKYSPLINSRIIMSSAVDKTRNMEPSGIFRNIPEHEKKYQFLFKNLKIK